MFYSLSFGASSSSFVLCRLSPLPLSVNKTNKNINNRQSIYRPSLEQERVVLCERRFVASSCQKKSIKAATTRVQLKCFLKIYITLDVVVVVVSRFFFYYTHFLLVSLARSIERSIVRAWMHACLLAACCLLLACARARLCVLAVNSRCLQLTADSLAFLMARKK